MILIDAEKAFGKILTYIHDKNYKGNFLSSIESIYKEPTANITLNDERLNTFPIRSETGQEYLPYYSFSKTYTGSLRQCNKAKKEIKVIHIRKQEIKLSLLK